MFEPARPFACIAIAFGMLIGSIGGPTAASAQTTYLRVPSYEPKSTAIVMDAKTGEVLYAERADSPRYPASVTKLMTFYLAFESLATGRLHLGDMIVVSPHAAAQPATKLGLRSGETIRVEDALHAMAVHSANDMAVAVAERIGGTESEFAAQMTLKAQQLGMLNTRYVNANGLPDNRQISSARDIAILARAIIRDYPQYYSFFSQQEFTYRGKTMVNTNHLLGKMPGVDGLKTGFTNAAGFNLAASAMRNGHRLIAVVMGGSSGAVRNANVEGLLLTGFDIMQRRDRGEKILATQDLFAPQTGGYGAYHPSPEASDPIDVVLTRTDNPTGPLTVSNTMAAAKAGRVADAIRQAAVTPGGGKHWWIQVGRFRSRGEARGRVEKLAHGYARLLDDAEGSVENVGRAFRARFSGMTETAAREACSTVRSRGIPCVTGGRA